MKRDQILNARTGTAKLICDEEGNPIEVIPTSIQQITHNPQISNHFTPYIGHYHSSALHLMGRDGRFSAEDFGIVPAYLLLHAFELRLKEILHFQDQSVYSVENLRKIYGHDINSLITQIKGEITPVYTGISEADQKYIQNVFKQYKEKLFNYSDNISPAKPVDFDVERINRILLKVIKNIQNK